MAVAGTIAFVWRVLVMHAGDEAAQIGDHSGEGQAEGLPPRQKDIVMSGVKVTRASCRSRPEAPFHAIALGRVADFLGDGEADARLGLRCRSNLQPKRRAPGAIAPGGSQKLRAPLQAAQCRFRLGKIGRHPANNPLGRQLLAAEGTAAIENRAAVLGGHAGAETVTTGTHELAGLVCTLHNIRPRLCTVPLFDTACAEMVVEADKPRRLRVGASIGKSRRQVNAPYRHERDPGSGCQARLSLA